MSVIFLKYEFASQIALILSKTIGYYVFYGIYHQIIPNVNIVNIVNIVSLASALSSYFSAKIGSFRGMSVTIYLIDLGYFWPAAGEFFLTWHH